MLAAAARLRSAGKAVEMCRGLVGTKAKHTLPDLPYDYGALEPVISGEIMELHHSKHHQAYVNGLNAATEQMADAADKGDVKTMTKLTKAIKVRQRNSVLAAAPPFAD